MPKVTRHGGVSDANEPQQVAEPAFVGACSVCQAGATGIGATRVAVEGLPEDSWATYTAGDLTVRYEPCGHEVVKEGGEQPSPGNSSETSAEKPQSSDEPKTPSRPRPARTTANRSKKPKGNSTAGSADA